MKRKQKKEWKRIIYTAVIMSICCFCLKTQAFAEASLTVMGSYTGESDLSIYVKGDDLNAQEVSVQIGAAEAGEAHAQRIEELEIPMQTLLMVDNSLSITAKNQKKIDKFMQRLISDRLPNEEMSIATFSEEAHSLVDYTSEYEELRQAADSISYQRQSTYLTDALYDMIMEAYVNKPMDVYRRIVIISDGVDKKSIGYTKEELYALIQDAGVPIYTIGCKNGKNNEELENMFALSRLTHADYCLLDKIKDLSEITSELKTDRSILKLAIKPSKEQMDGSRKAVRVAFSGDRNVTHEMPMPQLPLANAAASEPGSKTAAEQDGETEKAPAPSMVILLIASGAALILIAVTVLIVLKKRGQAPGQDEGPSPGFAPSPHESERVTTPQSMHRQQEGQDEVTQPLYELDENGGDGRTVILWDQMPAIYMMSLTDLHNEKKSFQMTMERPILIGRKAGVCDIALDYEPSVSGEHCEISARDGRFYVKDLHSSNGTLLNGARVKDEAEIASGSVLQLGRLELRFEIM